MLCGPRSLPGLVGGLVPCDGCSKGELIAPRKSHHSDDAPVVPPCNAARARAARAPRSSRAEACGRWTRASEALVHPHPPRQRSHVRTGGEANRTPVVHARHRRARRRKSRSERTRTRTTRAREGSPMTTQPRSPPRPKDTTRPLSPLRSPAYISRFPAFRFSAFPPLAGGRGVLRWRGVRIWGALWPRWLGCFVVRA